MGRNITQFFIVLFFALNAWAQTTTIQADALRSADRTKTWTLPATTGTLVCQTCAQTLTNKTITGGTVSGTTVIVNDDVLTIQDNADNTKKAKFEVSGVSASTTRTYTLPNASGTLADLGSAQNFTGTKTFTVDAYMSNSNLYVSTAGKGIVFTANGDAAGAASNNLDDYERGTFTPAVRGSGTAGSGSYTTQTGSYEKIGKRVFFALYVDMSSMSGLPTGNIQITGLPFTAATTNYHAVYVGYTTNLSWAAGYQIGGYVEVNSSFIALQKFYDALGISPVAIDTSFGIMVGGHYIVP